MDDRGRDDDRSRDEATDLRRGRGVVARIAEISGLSERGRGGSALSIIGVRALDCGGKEGRGVFRMAGADVG